MHALDETTKLGRWNSSRIVYVNRTLGAAGWCTWSSYRLATRKKEKKQKHRSLLLSRVRSDRIKMIMSVRMLTLYDIRLVPRFPDLRFSQSVLDLFSRVRSSRFSLCVRPSSFYGIAYFSLPLYPLLPVVKFLVCAYDSPPFVAQHRSPLGLISSCASLFPVVVPALACHPIFPFRIACICCTCVSP